VAGEKPDKDSDEKRFNETLQRMLKTPPKTTPKAGRAEKERKDSKMPKKLSRKD